MSSEAANESEQQVEAETRQDKRQPHNVVESLGYSAAYGGGTFTSPAERLASNIGNQNFNAVVARMADGEGITAGGRIHPDVEAAIAASRGTGQSLHSDLAATLSSSYGDPLNDVSVHTGPSADSLARAVSARAFTVGSDIFFASGEYNPATPSGQELIAHEVAHVVQQRGAPDSGPLTVTTPGDAMEREAESAAREAFL